MVARPQKFEGIRSSVYGSHSGIPPRIQGGTHLHRKLFGAGALVALVLCTSACQTVHYATHRSGGGAVVEENADFFLFGLIGEKVVNMNDVCPAAGPARWYNQQSFVNGLLGVITFGIYTPRTIVIECSASSPNPAPTSAEASAPSAS
jgi:Bor protein